MAVVDKADVIKHLEMIQAIINRMAANSFLLKGWSPTVAAALMAFALDNMNRWLAAMALLPLVGFWALDAYYLRRERLYRRLHDHVRHALLDLDAPLEVELFCMNTKIYELTKKTKSNEKDGKVESLLRIMVATGVTTWVHVPIIATVVLFVLFWH